MSSTDRDSSLWDDYGYHHDDLDESIGAEPSAKGDDDEAEGAP